MKEFAKKLKEWRLSKGYSQGDCVDAVNAAAGTKLITQSHWSQYENGLFEPKQKIAKYIKAAFEDIDFIEVEAKVYTSIPSGDASVSVSMYQSLKDELNYKQQEIERLWIFINRYMDTMMPLSKQTGNSVPQSGMFDIKASRQLMNSPVFKSGMLNY